MTATNERLPLIGKTVLLADHQPNSRVALREMASRLGATNILTTTNAGDAVRQASAGSIDLILCDYQLDGERDGQQLLEELRNTRQIPQSTMFMMITGERSYRKVVAVAEFAPDAYLLKPFTADQLRERVAAVAARKRAFAGVFALMEGGRLDEAVAECGVLRASSPQHAGEALRLMTGMLLTLKRHDEAEVLLQEVVAHNEVAWAGIGLARIRYAEGDLKGAEAGFADIVEMHPEYLGAKDMLAKVKEDLGKAAEALAVLEQAGAAAQGNLSRLRHAGALATLAGDHRKAALLYEKVVARVRHSALGRADDFVALANAYLEHGRSDQADRVSVELRRIMGDAPDAALVAQLIEYQRYRRDPSTAAQALAAAALDALLAMRGELGAAAAALSANIEFDIFNACCLGEREADILAVGEALLARADAGAKMIERVTAQLAETRQEQARKSAIIPLDQVLAMLARMLAKQWDDAVGDACQASVAHWGRLTPDDERLPAARERLGEVMRKFGKAALLDEPVVEAA